MPDERNENPRNRRKCGTKRFLPAIGAAAIGALLDQFAQAGDAVDKFGESRTCQDWFKRSTDFMMNGTNCEAIRDNTDGGTLGKCVFGIRNGLSPGAGFTFTDFVVAQAEEMYQACKQREREIKNDDR